MGCLRGFLTGHGDRESCLAHQGTPEGRAMRVPDSKPGHERFREGGLLPACAEASAGRRPPWL
jgi:hypothetical protein